MPPPFQTHHLGHGDDSSEESEGGLLSSGAEGDSEGDPEEDLHHESAGLVRRASKDLEAIAIRERTQTV